MALIAEYPSAGSDAQSSNQFGERQIDRIGCGSKGCDASWEAVEFQRSRSRLKISGVGPNLPRLWRDVVLIHTRRGVFLCACFAGGAMPRGFVLSAGFWVEVTLVFRTEECWSDIFL